MVDFEKPGPETPIDENVKAQNLEADGFQEGLGSGLALASAVEMLELGLHRNECFDDDV